MHPAEGSEAKDGAAAVADPGRRWGGIALYLDACKWSRYDNFYAYYWNDALGHDRLWAVRWAILFCKWCVLSYVSKMMFSIHVALQHNEHVLFNPVPL